ncbi:MAG: hypothetical protein JW884_13240 [Deltaproteobacteria bacterium]|nr:hypothetical protein [Deltaproteobacteria bacterium]
MKTRHMIAFAATFATAAVLLTASCKTAPVSVDAPMANRPATLSEPVRLAVLYFDNNSVTDREELDPFSKGLADTIITDLAAVEGLTVVERTKMAALLDEMALGQTGAVEGATAQRIGRLLGAQRLLVGSYVALGPVLRIDSRIIDVETGRVAVAFDVTGSPDDFFVLEELLVRKILSSIDSRQGAARAARISISRKSLKALLSYSRGIAFLDLGDKAGAELAFREALRLDPSYREAELRLKHLRQP